MANSIITILSFLTLDEMKHLIYPIDRTILHKLLRNRRDEICDFFLGKEYARMVDKDWKLLELITDSLAITSLDDKLIGKQEDKVVSFINKARALDSNTYSIHCKDVRSRFFQ